MTDHLEDIYIPPEQYEMAMKLMTLLKVLVIIFPGTETESPSAIGNSVSVPTQ